MFINMFRVDGNNFSHKNKVDLESALPHQLQLTSIRNLDGTGCEDGLHIDNSKLQWCGWPKARASCEERGWCWWLKRKTKTDSSKR